MFSLLKRFAVEDSGMEMLEWAIVATLFAVATAAAFSTFSGALKDQIGTLSDVFTQTTPGS